MGTLTHALLAGALGAGCLVACSQFSATDDGDAGAPDASVDVVESGTDAAPDGAQRDAALPLSYARTVMGDGPTHYWRLGDTPPGLRDTATGTNDATYSSNAAKLTMSCPADSADGCVTLDGTVYIKTNEVVFDVMKDFSIEAWVNPMATTPDFGIVSQEDGNGHGYAFAVTSTNLRFTGDVLPFISTAFPSVVGWEHVVVIRSGDAFHLYLNGKEATSTSSLPIPTITAAPTDHFVIAARAGGFAEPLQGGLDDVATYDHALSPARVMAHYLASSKAEAMMASP